MNKLTELMQGIFNSDAVLADAVVELERFAETGILGQGLIRQGVKVITETTEIETSHALSLVETYVLRTAASKWALQVMRKMVNI